MTLSRLPKPKKPSRCAICRGDFIKRNMNHKLCGKEDCAIAFGEKSHEKSLRIAAKVERQSTNKRKDALKTRSDYMKSAQTAWNSYVRWRDHGLPCVSCGVTITHKPGGHNVDCSHYRSVGSAPHMRFHLHNAAAACVRCNRDLSGNVVELRKGLVDRIGLAKVEVVECDNEVRKFDIDYLKRIKRIFTKKCNRIKKTNKY
jgi:NinG protein